MSTINRIVLGVAGLICLIMGVYSCVAITKGDNQWLKHSLQQLHPLQLLGSVFGRWSGALRSSWTRSQASSASGTVV
jgi:hypothetical protein